MGNKSPNHAASVKSWAQRNRKKACAITRKWQKAHPEQFKRMARNTALKRNFGITLEQYEVILVAQGYHCALFEICGSTKPGGRGTWHVDHDHVTGRIRGLLCHHCNLHRVGMNDLASIQMVARYLQG